ncbi:MAG: hypothetical protein ACE5GW_06940 [Planctomycetota bacterium]
MTQRTPGDLSPRASLGALAPALLWLLFPWGSPAMAQEKAPARGGEEAAAAPPRLLLFGTRARIGNPVSGHRWRSLELMREVRTAYGHDRQFRLYQDDIIGRDAAFRFHSRQAQMEVIGDHTDYLYRPSPIRKVSVTIDGRSISHLNEGIGPQRGPGMPQRMDDPLILEEGFVASFQLAFERWLAKRRSVEGAHPLDGLRFEAIVPQTLRSHTFVMAVKGEEVVELPGAESANMAGEAAKGRRKTTVLEVTRLEPPRHDGVRDATLDTVRRFWITSAGEIVKMEMSHQRRFQGEMVTWNLNYRPGFAGEITEGLTVPVGPEKARQGIYSTTDARLHLDPGAVPRKGPAILFITDPANEARWVEPFLRWELAPAGLRTLAVAMTGSEEEDLQAARAALELLRKRPDVAADQVSILSYGGTLKTVMALLEDAAPGGAARWIAINGGLEDPPEIGPARLRKALLESGVALVAVWGEAGEEEGPVAARRAWGDLLREAARPGTGKEPGVRIEILPLEGLNARLRPAPSGEGAAESGAGLSPRFLEVIRRRVLPGS